MSIVLFGRTNCARSSPKRKNVGQPMWRPAPAIPPCMSVGSGESICDGSKTNAKRWPPSAAPVKFIR